MNYIIQTEARQERAYESIWLALKAKEKVVLICHPARVKTIIRMVEKEKYNDASFRLGLPDDCKPYLRNSFDTTTNQLTFLLHYNNNLPWESEVMSTSISSVPMSNLEQIKERIASLQEALQKNLPNYESLLHTIHSNLQKLDQDCVHLLSEEEIGVIVAGLSKKVGVVIHSEAEKKSKKGKVSLEDLM